MKNLYYSIRTYQNIIKKDLDQKFHIPLSKKFKLWKNGFLAEKYVLYQLDQNDSNLYLSDYHASMARWINEPFNELLTNKLIFSEYVGQFVKVPKIFGIFVEGIYYPKTGEPLLIHIKATKAFVVKDVNGGGGKGVFIVKSLANGDYSVNNTIIYKENDLLAFFRSLNNYILTEYIYPGDFSKSLNQDSVNTMRIVTLINPQTKKAFIAAAAQRIGVKASAPQDNFTKGALSALINLDTGELSEATGHPKSSKHQKYKYHPDTNRKIQGVKIPDWENLKNIILSAANDLPMLKCVGWDFLISQEGLVAIEGNHHPDPDVLQAHEPLLINPDIRDFYQYYKIL